jgi:GH24 family phage-related lysozyme (muramidase)
MNTESIDKIKRWEVYSPTKYLDVVDKDGKEWWCIGFGHGGASGVWPSHDEIVNGNLYLTLEQATEILHNDLSVEYLPKTSNLIKCNMTTFMTGAMVMCAFNMGMTKFKKTSMVTHLNNGKYIAACASLKNYNRAVNPKTLLLEERNGLTCRRMDEGSLFLTKR